MSLNFEVMCDRCGRVGMRWRRKTRPVQEVRDELAAKGWKVLQYGGVDHCPDCIAALDFERGLVGEGSSR